jgi:hypothetical protein
MCFHNDGFITTLCIQNDKKEAFCHSERSEESYTIDKSQLYRSCVYGACIRFFALAQNDKVPGMTNAWLG